ncbi:MAG TPA: cupin domain-containing protein [Acidimicrobiales bacterium]|nr:MAG: cupin [Actinobacteria bacterium 21-64-8]HQT99561.1 cupin domain-containing protein [Acidimicrobiales bacterium]
MTASPGEQVPLRHVRRGDVSASTAQSEGMHRFAAISGALTGAQKIWMGETHMAPASASAVHHHGDSETGIYVVSGHPTFVFFDDGVEQRVQASPGDYVFVPAFVAHQELNTSSDEPALVVLARSSQEAIVVNLPGLA